MHTGLYIFRVLKHLKQDWKTDFRLLYCIQFILCLRFSVVCHFLFVCVLQVSFSLCVVYQMLNIAIMLVTVSGLLTAKMNRTQNVSKFLLLMGRLTAAGFLIRLVQFWVPGDLQVRYLWPRVFRAGCPGHTSCWSKACKKGTVS